MTTTARTLELIGGKEATPEQLALNVARWRAEQLRREELKKEAQAKGISPAQVKALRALNAKKLTQAREAERKLKLGGNLHATVADVANWFKG